MPNNTIEKIEIDNARIKLNTMIENHKKIYLAILPISTLIVGLIYLIYQQVTTISASEIMQNINQYKLFFCASEFDMCSMILSIIAVQFINDGKIITEIFNLFHKKRINLKYKNKLDINIIKSECSIYNIYLTLCLTNIFMCTFFNVIYMASSVIYKNIYILNFVHDKRIYEFMAITGGIFLSIPFILNIALFSTSVTELIFSIPKIIYFSSKDLFIDDLINYIKKNKSKN